MIGAFAAVEKDLVKAAVSALAYYGVAAEEALKISGSDRPGTFQMELLNQLSQVEGAFVKKAAILARVE
ncbi:Hydroxyethylthiazole kinase [compost metagenome]